MLSPRLRPNDVSIAVGQPRADTSATRGTQLYILSANHVSVVADNRLCMPSLDLGQFIPSSLAPLPHAWRPSAPFGARRAMPFSSAYVDRVFVTLATADRARSDRRSSPSPLTAGSRSIRPSMRTSKTTKSPLSRPNSRTPRSPHSRARTASSSRRRPRSRSTVRVLPFSRIFWPSYDELVYIFSSFPVLSI
jgi:hypothetical protein